MTYEDRKILTEHVAFMRRMTENSRRSHGWIFDAEIAALQRALDEDPMTDTQRLDFLTSLVKLPTVSFHFNDGGDDEMPPGFTIRADESCMPAVQESASTFRAAIGKFERAMKRAIKTAEHGNG